MNAWELGNDINAFQEFKQYGGRIAIHVGNAHPPTVSKFNLGYIGYMLGDDDIWITLICDGYHIDPVGIKVMIRAKGFGRTILATDMMAATGKGPGTYPLGGGAVEIKEGDKVAWLNREARTFAGSILTPLQQVVNAQKFALIPLSAAWPMASLNPACALRIPYWGALVPGWRASLTVLKVEQERNHLEVLGTMIDGKWCYTSDELVERGAPRVS